MVPRHSLETRRPVWPKRTCCKVDGIVDGTVVILSARGRFGPADLHDLKSLKS
jgi:hypothetical protein